MVIGAGIVILRLAENDSLKGKRKIVKSVIAKIRNTFNASAAEVGANDIHQRAEIGFSIVGNDRQFINSIVDKVFNTVDEMGVAELIDTDMEIISLR